MYTPATTGRRVRQSTPLQAKQHVLDANMCATPTIIPGRVCVLAVGHDIAEEHARQLWVAFPVLARRGKNEAKVALAERNVKHLIRYTTPPPLTS